MAIVGVGKKKKKGVVWGGQWGGQTSVYGGRGHHWPPPGSATASGLLG